MKRNCWSLKLVICFSFRNCSQHSGRNYCAKKIHSGAEFLSKRYYLKDLTGAWPPSSQLYLKYLVTVKIKCPKQTLLRILWSRFLEFIVLGVDWFWLEARLLRRLYKVQEVSHWERIFGPRIKTRKAVHQRTFISPVSWEYEKTTQTFLFRHSKIQGNCLHFLLTEYFSLGFLLNQKAHTLILT